MKNMRHLKNILPGAFFLSSTYEALAQGRGYGGYGRGRE